MSEDKYVKEEDKEYMTVLYEDRNVRLIEWIKKGVVTYQLDVKTGGPIDMDKIFKKAEGKD